MIWLQILGLIFGLFMLYLTFLYYKRKDYGITGFIVWIIVWLAFMAIVTFPNMFYGLMGALRIERTVDFIVALTVVFFLIIAFYLYAITKKTQKDVEAIVRKIAIEKKK